MRDPLFKSRLKSKFQTWVEVKGRLGFMDWWEDIVKPGVKQLLIQSGKEIVKERRGRLNLLLIQQAYLVRKLHNGCLDKLKEHKKVQLEINEWYQEESKKLQIQSKMDEIVESETVNIFHHEIHKKHITKSSILKLTSEENESLNGHHECAAYLEKCVSQLLSGAPQLDSQAQSVLLQEVEEVFSEEDNALLLKTPTKEEVFKNLCESNLHAAPGSDGLTSYFYKECWDIMGDSLVELACRVHNGENLTLSQITLMMIFCSKPKKLNSTKQADKRKLSLLNADFKAITGIEAKRFKMLSTHTLSTNQLAAGSNRRIYHGVNRVRDTVQSMWNKNISGGVLDNDYKMAFDLMIMLWVFQVLRAKGVDQRVIERLKNIYQDNITVVVVNGVPGKAVKNTRWSMRQGDLPSVFWFCYGIEPLVIYLEKRLKGLTIYSSPKALFFKIKKIFSIFLKRFENDKKITCPVQKFQILFCSIY